MSVKDKPSTLLAIDEFKKWLNENYERITDDKKRIIMSELKNEYGHKLTPYEFKKALQDLNYNLIQPRYEKGFIMYCNKKV